MTKSKNYGFNLPSRDTDDIADINQIAENFRIIDKEMHKVAETASEPVQFPLPLAIVNSASGNTISLSDASVLPLQKLNVYGKTEQTTFSGSNILPEDFWDFNSGKWTSIDGSYYYYHFDVADGTVITISAPHNTGELAKDLYVNIGVVAGSANMWLYHPTATNYNHNSVTVTAENGEGIYIRMHLPRECLTALKEAGLWVNIGEKSLPYEPYTGGMPSPNPDYPQSMNTPTDVQVKVNGANILNVYVNDVYTNSTSTAFDISTVNNGFRIEAVAEVSNTSARRGYCIGTKKELMGKTITVSAKYTTSRTGSTAVPSICLYSLSVPQGYIGNTTTTPQLKLAQIENAPLTFTIDDSCPYDYIGVLFLYSYGGAWKVGDWSQYDDIQVQIGDTVTPFEPYTEQLLTVPTMSDIGLAGVPVTKGGNYTDTNGQQWVCDEVDFKRGVYVQRIMKYTVTGTERWGISSVSVTNAARFDCTVSGYPAAVIEDVLSSHCVYSGTNKIDTSIGMNMWARGALDDLYRLNLRIVLPTGSTVETLTTFLQEEMTKGTPVEILYALNTPIETPLDAETLSAFATLHTNKPNTTITNNAGVWMSAEYVADTKLYIDNKFAELAKAIVSNS